MILLGVNGSFGKTPNEVYHDLSAANAAPRIEPRPDWPRGSPCASPQAPIRGKPGMRVALHVTFCAGRKHLPIIELKQVA